MQKIYYKETEITQLFTRGKWQHPETGIKYPANWNPLTIEGVIVIDEPEPLIESIQMVKSWTPLQFIEQFTDDEQLSVKTLSMSNAQIGLWYDKLLASQEVIVDDARLIAGLNALVSAGVLTQERVDEILG